MANLKPLFRSNWLGGLLTILLGTSFLTSCQNKTVPEREFEISKAICYQAIYGADTAYMELDTTEFDVIGKLRFYYADQKKYVGDFKGIIKADTLKGHFDFQLNGEQQWRRNPVSFILRDNKWIMGDGKFVLVWGTGHFDPLVPIDYSNSKFHFQQTPCKL